MENASKALIIAGAILISIVLVSVGVIVVNSLNPDDALTRMSEQEVEAFNSKFIGSIGNNKQGSLVRTLISTVGTNNTQYDESSGKQVKIILGTGMPTVSGVTATGETDATKLALIRNAIVSTARYNLTSTFNNIGIIDSITINKVP